MSFLNGLIDLGKSAYNFVTQNSIGSSLLKTVISGIALNQVSKSINKQSDAARTQQTTADQGVVVTANASTENKIPVLYGRAVTGGQLIDVRMTNNNQTMYYVYVISERTGTVFSTNQPTAYSLHRVFWSGYEIVFQNDGITAAALKDLQDTTRTDINGLVRVYFYSNGSSSGQYPVGATGPGVPPAFTVVPGWTASWQMTNLVFAVVEVNYNRAKSITGVGDMSFDVESTMTLPGDVIFDYMTNTRYGAAIPANNIRT
jgi:hypothetical protein